MCECVLVNDSGQGPGVRKHGVLATDNGSKRSWATNSYVFRTKRNLFNTHVIINVMMIEDGECGSEYRIETARVRVALL